MDIILEIADGLIFDPVYAYLFPALPGPDVYRHGGLKRGFANRTISSLKEAPTAFPIFNNYVWTPASQYISLAPGETAYMTSVPRDNAYRQWINLYLITWIFGMAIYFIFAGLSYRFVFDHATFKHPKYLKNQVRLEIIQTMKSMPGMAVLTASCFTAEVRGYSKLYDTTAEGPGLWWNIVQFPFFILFTDCFIYWIHRTLHHPSLYKRLHKPHHRWIMPTPFASHAFHPLDGFAQSVPYHVFPFLFPLQKWAYVVLFVFINFWTILIHDGEFVMNNPIINGAACHTMHHLAFSVNYGQFTTLWDRLGGSYRVPQEELFEKEKKLSKETMASQSREMEAVVKEVEGEDDRVFLVDEKKKQ